MEIRVLIFGRWDCKSERTQMRGDIIVVLDEGSQLFFYGERSVLTFQSTLMDDRSPRPVRVGNREKPGVLGLELLDLGLGFLKSLRMTCSGQGAIFLADLCSHFFNCYNGYSFLPTNSLRKLHMTAKRKTSRWCLSKSLSISCQQMRRLPGG